ncbi:hypothetical protein DFJ74DRAFT_696382 [Hyaloraphidium curvatum]|nr:hypothetical protein DFJ74DRAFT_696382 [Hyaloraphidium curvatum]
MQAAVLRIPFACTEYTEQSLDTQMVLVRAVLERARMFAGDRAPREADVRMGINPFRDPGQRRIPAFKVPNFNNGFLMTMYRGEVAEP